MEDLYFVLTSKILKMKCITKWSSLDTLKPDETSNDTHVPSKHP